MSLFIRIYEILIPFLMTILHIVAIFDSKTRKLIDMRRLKNGKYPWNIENYENCVLVHAASGEFEYAKPVIRELLKKGEKVLVTYHSPSYQKQIQNFPGIKSCPLPWDKNHLVRDFLGQVQPKYILIARTDFWPNFLKNAKSLKIPIFLFSATLHPKKLKNSFVIDYYHYFYSFFHTIFCVSFEDQQNFYDFKLHHRVVTIGDTRYDQVLNRIQNPNSIKSELFEIEILSEKSKVSKIFLAGSTWAEDEVKICKLAKLLESISVRTIIAPHEPNSVHLRSLQQHLKKYDLDSILYSQAKSWSPNKVLIVDQIGILADLYKYAEWAFVGGSFRRQVHSVLEPLAQGCYTLVGPFHTNNREALEYQKIQKQLKNITITPVKSFIKTQEAFEFIKASSMDPKFYSFKNELKLDISKRIGASLELVNQVSELVRNRN